MILAKMLSCCTIVTDWDWSTQQASGSGALLGQIVIGAIKKFVKRRCHDSITRTPFFISSKFFIPQADGIAAIMALQGSNGGRGWDQMTATSALMTALHFCMRPKRRCNNCYSWI